MTRRLFWLSILLMFPYKAVSQQVGQTNVIARPNIVFILVDDLRWDEYRTSLH